MRNILAGLLSSLLVALGACNKQASQRADSDGFISHIKFNHVYVVIDDSTYKYLFDSLRVLNKFARLKEETVKTDKESWTGKYLFGINNYVEILTPSSGGKTKLGDLGIGFATNQFGSLRLLQKHWATTLDSVHVENRVITENGKTAPWFTSISIPKADSLKISAWVMENSKEEMLYAGFSEKELGREIEFAEYFKRMRAKASASQSDSASTNKLFDKITRLDISLPKGELIYLRKSLLDIGFIEKGNSFTKDNFAIVYTPVQSKQFLLRGINFSLLQRMPKQQYSFRGIGLTVDGYQATMRFNY